MKTVLPLELIFQIVELYLSDPASLSACSLVSSSLRPLCQKQLFSSIEVHIDLKEPGLRQDRNDTLFRIITDNPSIASYVSTLTVVIAFGNLETECPLLLSFTHVKRLNISSYAYRIILCNALNDAMERLILLPSMSTVDVEFSLALRLYESCARINKLYISPNSPLPDQPYSVPHHPVKSTIDKLLLSTLHCCHILQMFKFDSLGTIMLEIRPGAQLNDTQAFLDSVFFSLRSLELHFDHDLTHANHQIHLSLEKLSRLENIEFVLYGNWPITNVFINAACDILLTAKSEGALSIVKIFEFSSLPPILEGSSWKRLDQTLAQVTNLKNLCIQTRTRELWHIEDHLTSLMSLNKVVFEDVPYED